ncbi:putative ubiquinol-cytochrome c reductase complex 11 kDa protein [Serendipita vermifera]|nr:putative ubiquinol-cytochrome c reductase complex 11 kDa protein [Serendipita vermifera]
MSVRILIGWWGAMGSPTQKGITSYTVSPYRQKAMHGAFSGYTYHGIRRLAQNAPYFVPPFAVGYFVYTWAKAKDHYNNSKAAHVKQMETGHAPEH